ncbi:MAG: hypothetical protein Q9159_002974 [Coniocarpon cinnabarinum]
MANELASTLQSATIKQNPDPDHDLDPSTAASVKSPVKLDHVRPVCRSASHSSAEDEYPLSVLRPAPRTHNLPPLPDLRFEQSYLARIKHCQSHWSVAWVTFLDHVFMPLAQGVIWNLGVFGWRAWNRGVKFRGKGVGAKIRRWWWGVNGWDIPKQQEKAEKVREFYTSNFGSGAGD